MKKVFSFAILLFSLNATAQPTLKTIDEEANQKKTGDDKSILVPVLGALANLVSQDGQTLLFQPTLYSLATIFDPALKSDKDYARMRFARSLQFNLGIVTSEQSIFKYDGARLGFTYGMLNNKSLGAKDYSDLTNSQEFQDFRKISVELAIYAGNHLADAGGLLAMKLFRDGFTATDIMLMPAELKAKITQSLNAKTELDISARMAAFGEKFNRVVEGLKKKSALTFEFNAVRDFADKDWEEIAITPVNFYAYWLKKWKKSPAFNAKFSYEFSRDALTKQALKRKVVASEIGFNFPVLVNKNDEPVIEIKPGVKHSYVAAGRDDKEKKSNFDPAAIFRFRINKNFYLPIKVEYDSEQANMLGFLSIQYSLK